ncbi:unnamed protein product [Pieris brassicae]|uniref:Uncharacterized protein n=1 Tax=Pieris brassicae TaxID=7116 RepID=A0A9P0X9Q6_PIEBR|nr:unnamed protein product [Pieris brassicae]
MCGDHPSVTKTELNVKEAALEDNDKRPASSFAKLSPTVFELLFILDLFHFYIELLYHDRLDHVGLALRQAMKSKHSFQPSRTERSMLSSEQRARTMSEHALRAMEARRRAGTEAHQRSDGDPLHANRALIQGKNNIIFLSGIGEFPLAAILGVRVGAGSAGLPSPALPRGHSGEGLACHLQILPILPSVDGGQLAQRERRQRPSLSDRSRVRHRPSVRALLRLVSVVLRDAVGGGTVVLGRRREAEHLRRAQDNQLHR